MKLKSFGALACLLTAASAAVAQEPVPRAPRFEFGVYGGASYTTDWFAAPVGGSQQGWRPGFAPVLGVTISHFFSPSLGLRLHTAYLPQQLPEPSGLDISDSWVVNSYLYDLDLVLRPSSIRPAYAFLGAGGFTANIAGASPYPGCLGGGYPGFGICVSDRPSHGTTGQVNVGAGTEMLALSRSLLVFLEAALHAYDSPARGEAPPGEDKLTFTPRLVLGLKTGVGNLSPQPVPPAPPVAPPPPPPVEPPPPAAQPENLIQVCVVGADGALTNVTARYRPATGDTLVDGRSFSEAYPTDGRYAAGASWYINNEPLQFGGRRYVKYSLPRILGVAEVVRTGEVHGVGVYAEPAAGQAPEVIYVPVRPGCEFQPYQMERKVGGVRG